MKKSTAIILAGGKSRRLGFDKAFLRIGGETLIRRQFRILKRHFRTIIIVTNSPGKFGNLKGATLVSDILPYGGPLVGIASGLKAAGKCSCFVVACDMPFIDYKLIEYMYSRARGYDVVVPRIDGKYEPLFCIYSSNCLRHIERLLERRIFKITAFFPGVRVREVEKEEVSRHASVGTVFSNINTRGDLRRFRRLMSLPGWRCVVTGRQT